MTEEAARAADGGLSNASCSVRGVRRDPTRDVVDHQPGGEECGVVPSRRDGRPVVLWGPRDAARVAKQKKSPLWRLSRT